MLKKAQYYRLRIKKRRARLKAYLMLRLETFPQTCNVEEGSLNLEDSV